MAIGIVDSAPIKLLKAVAGNYHVAPAVERARAFLASCGIAQTREEMFIDTKVLRTV